MIHGDYSTYNNHKCRCAPCTEAHRIKMKADRERRKGSPNTPHGTLSGYQNWNCRCNRCKQVRSDQYGMDLEYWGEIDRRQKLILAFIDAGLSTTEIENQFGINKDQIYYALRKNGRSLRKPVPTKKSSEFKRLKKVKDTVSDRNKLIRVVREQGYTLEQIAAESGITGERVRQICL